MNRRKTRAPRKTRRGGAAPGAASRLNAERILAAVRRIPRGRVATYGAIADLAGLPRRARLVGTVLKHAPATRGLPWFRVIGANGRVSLPPDSDAYRRQRRMLQAEGIVFMGDRVDMKRYGWPPRDVVLDELLWKL